MLLVCIAERQKCQENICLCNAWIFTEMFRIYDWNNSFRVIFVFTRLKFNFTNSHAKLFPSRILVRATVLNGQKIIKIAAIKTRPIELKVLKAKFRLIIVTKRNTFPECLKTRNVQKLDSKLTRDGKAFMTSKEDTPNVIQLSGN